MALLRMLSELDGQASPNGSGNAEAARQHKDDGIRFRRGCCRGRTFITDIIDADVVIASLIATGIDGNAADGFSGISKADEVDRSDGAASSGFGKVDGLGGAVREGDVVGKEVLDTGKVGSEELNWCREGEGSRSTLHLQKVRSGRGGIEPIEGGGGREVGGIADGLVTAARVGTAEGDS